MKNNQITPVGVYHTLEQLGFELLGEHSTGLSYSRYPSLDVDQGYTLFSYNEKKNNIALEVNYMNHNGINEEKGGHYMDKIIKGYSAISNVDKELKKQGYSPIFQFASKDGYIDDNGVELILSDIDMDLPHEAGVQKIKGLTSIVEREFDKLK